LQPTRSAQIGIVDAKAGRRVPGGIATYRNGLVSGLKRVLADGTTEPTGQGREREAELARPTIWEIDETARYRPGSVWRRRLSGLAVAHFVSLAVPNIRSGRRVTVMVHDLLFLTHGDAYGWHGRQWHRQALARTLRVADALVVPSKAVADQLAGLVRSSTRVEVIRHGCDHLDPPDPDGAERLLAHLPVGDRWMMAVGTLEPRKNLPRVVAAFEQFRRRHDRQNEWSLLVVGPSGWGDRIVVEPASGVVLTGPVNGPILTELYRRAAAVVYIPFAEGYGLPPVEAMSQGTAVIATRVPSIEGLADDACCFVQPEEVDQIADAMASLAKDPAQRSAMAEGARRWASKQTWARSARLHLELWSDL
jgi:glycosyltransferase involved in cell wall biosynthesis